MSTGDRTARAAEGQRWLVAAAWFVLLTALVSAFGYTLYEMFLRWFPAWQNTHWPLYDRFVEGESYYTHGPLIPLISLLIACLLVRYTTFEVRPCPAWGWPLLGVSLLVHLVACLARVNFVSGFAIIGVLAGLVLLLWGPAALRRLWFPLAFLAFMVPLPEVTIASWNFRLKMIAAEWGVRIADLLGIVADLTGNRVFLEGGKSLVIANVCNGLRTLISLVAFGALYAYICKLRGLWRIGLFLMAVPVALLANTARIVSLIVVADVADVETATGWFHDTSGLLVFVVAFLLMFLLEKAILGLRRLAGKPATIVPLFGDCRCTPEHPSPWHAMNAVMGRSRGWAAGMVVLLVAGLGGWLHRATPPRQLSPEVIAQIMPERITLDGKLYYSYPLELDERTLTILEHPTYLNRRYVAAAEPPVDFCLFFSKDNRKGIHPPDLCLEGGGNSITRKEAIDLDGLGGEPVPCMGLLVQRGRERLYLLYTYKCGEHYTRSFWNQQITIFANGLLGRNAGGALVRTSTPVERSVDEAQRRAVDMMRAAIPRLEKHLH